MEKLEIDLYTGERLNIEELLFYFHENNYAVKSVLSIDDWQWHNQRTIMLNEIAACLVQNKIIMVEMENHMHNCAGIQICGTGDLYQYTIWIDIKHMQLDRDYYTVVEKKVEKYLDKFHIHYIAIAIGSEIFTPDDALLINLIKQSHNVDTWIINQDYNIDIPATFCVSSSNPKIMAISIKHNKM